MKKYAVCMYGHIGKWEECRTSFEEKVLSRLKREGSVDVYVHVYNRQYYIREGRNVIYSNDEVEKMFEHVNYAKLMVEDDTASDYIEERKKEVEKAAHGLKDWGDPFKTICIMRKIHEVLEMVDNINEYDGIILTRPDLKYLTDLDLEWGTNEVRISDLHPFPDMSLVCGPPNVVKELRRYYISFLEGSPFGRETGYLPSGSWCLKLIGFHLFGKSPWHLAKATMKIEKHN